MIVANNEQISKDSGFFSYIPRNIRKYLYLIQTERLEEVRLRLGRPVMFYFSDGHYFLSKKGSLETAPAGAVICTKQDIEEGMELITASSVYAVEEQIQQGFVTVSGGHRVGICGSGVITDGNISFVKHICGLNYRFAHEKKGVADKLLPYICSGGQLLSTLIIAPPGCGKTTMLREITRKLSLLGKKISVVDERGELAGMVDGCSSYDLGYSTDILENVRKDKGMLMMLRSMSPDVIVTDEIGTESDVKAMKKIKQAGVRIIASIHGKNRGEIYLRESAECFQCFITLGKSDDGRYTVEEVYSC